MVGVRMVGTRMGRARSGLLIYEVLEGDPGESRRRGRPRRFKITNYKVKTKNKKPYREIYEAT